MICIPFMFWVILFLILMGITDAFKVSSKRISFFKFLGLPKQFYFLVKSLIVIKLILMSMTLELDFTHASQLLITVPFLYYFLHDGAYLHTRGIIEGINWKFISNPDETYTDTIHFSFKTRTYLFLFGLILFQTSILFLG